MDINLSPASRYKNIEIVSITRTNQVPKGDPVLDREVIVSGAIQTQRSQFYTTRYDDMYPFLFFKELTLSYNSNLTPEMLKLSHLPIFTTSQRQGLWKRWEPK